MSKLKDRAATAIKAGGWMHIILPDILGGFSSYKISTDSLLAGVGNNPLKIVNASANLNRTFEAGTYIPKIFIKKISGTPTLKIGTSPGGGDILSNDGFPFSIDSNVPVLVDQYFDLSTTIYFTISGGVINIRVDYENNYA